MWEFVDGSGGDITGTGVARVGETTQVTSGDRVTVVRDGDAGTTSPEVEGDDEVDVELLGAHGPDDGADLRVDVFQVSGTGRVSIVYDDAGAVRYDLIVT